MLRTMLNSEGSELLIILFHHVIGFAGDTSHTNYFMQSVWYHRPSSAHHSVLASHLDRNQRNPLTSPGETARRRRKFFEILIQKHLNSLRVHPENSFGIPEFEYIKNIFFVCGRLLSPELSGNVCNRCLCLLEQGDMLR